MSFVLTPEQHAELMRCMTQDSGFPFAVAQLALDLAVHAVNEAAAAIDTVASRAGDPMASAQVRFLGAQLAAAHFENFHTSVVETLREKQPDALSRTNGL